MQRQMLGRHCQSDAASSTSLQQLLKPESKTTLYASDRDTSAPAGAMISRTPTADRTRGSHRVKLRRRIRGTCSRACYSNERIHTANDTVSKLHVNL